MNIVSITPPASEVKEVEEENETDKDIVEEQNDKRTAKDPNEKDNDIEG